MASMAPSPIRSATTAHETRSPRNFGNITPRDTAPTWWPARPMRCMPDATDGGASIWITRSTAPMSMPSSSEDVATTHGSCPDLSASSTELRCSLDIDAVVRPGDRRRLDPGRPAGLGDRLRREAADVGGVDRTLGGQLVEPRGEPLGQPPRVGEHDRRPVLADQLAAPVPRPPARSTVCGCRRPRRSSPRACRCRRAATGRRVRVGGDRTLERRRAVELGHVLDRDHHASSR